MATRDFADVSSVLAKLFLDDVTNNINRATVLPQLLDVRDGKGQNIQWAAKFGARAASATVAIADGANVTTFNKDAKVPAVLQYQPYHDAFEVTGLAVAAAAAAGNPDQLADLFSEDMKDSSERLAAGIADHLFTGTGSGQIHGLCAAAGPLSETGVYAGIDRAVQTQWASNENAVGGPLTFAAMRALRRDIYNTSGKKPNLIICDATQHEKLGLLFGSERRYVDTVRLESRQIRLDGGYQVLEFDGIPVVEDVSCPSGQMLFLNTNYLHIMQLPDPASVMNQSLGHVDLSGTPEEQLGDGPMKIRARVNPLGRAGDKYSFQLISYLQLVSRACNVHGRLTGLT